LSEHGFPKWESDILGYFHPTKIHVAGKNFGNFDMRFIRRLKDFEKYIRIIHRMVDPGTLYLDPSKDETPPSLEECLKRAGVVKCVDHTSVGDALDVIRCLRFKWGVPFRN
jgi:hypothetical protein